MPQFQGTNEPEDPSAGNCAYISWVVDQADYLWNNILCNQTKFYICESLGKYITLLRPVKTDIKSILKYTFNLFTLRVALHFQLF